MTIDINELRRLALDGDLAAMQAIIIRLERAEKTNSNRLRANAPGGWIDDLRMERNSLHAKLTQLHKEADKFDDGIDWTHRALQAEAKIEQMEHPEPAAGMDKNGTLYNTVSHVRASDRALYFTSNISEGWLRAIDEALIVAHIGVANKSDTYEQAKEKLNNLIRLHVDVATDPAVNGGYKLVPVRLTPKIAKATGEQS